MRLTPIVALVSDEAMASLAPLLKELTSRFVATDPSEAWNQTMARNGWTPEAIAWGLIIAAASKQDLELHPPKQQ